MVVPMVVFAGSAYSESMKSGGRFCVGVFDSNLASVAVKMFHI
jgi:hypothetical protein